MNADRLLALYERVSEAPDAIARLRRFVLDLAVRGKLVEQDATDEPAAELLKRIQRARRKRVANGEMRPEKRILAPARDAEIFHLSPNWLWCVADSVWDFENGDRSTNYPSRDQLISSGVPFINAGHLVKGRVSSKQMNFITHEKFESLWGGKLRQGDQLYCLRGSLGKHAVFDTEMDAAIASSLVILRPVLADCVPYFSLYLDSSVAEIMLRRFDNGSAQPNLSSANLRRFEIPLPPLAEQQRIVAKVDELMALCDQLEETRITREDARDRLTRASLARLSTPDTDDVTFRSHARFAVDALPALTARADQVTHFRQTILNLAVQGRLVDQYPNDKPASALLTRIATEKARRGSKKGKASAWVNEPGSDDQIPFHLPKGWAQSTIGEICSKTGSGSTPRGGKNAYKPHGVIFLRSQNIHNNGLRLTDVAYIDERTHERMSGTSVRASDLLLNITGGSIGRCCLVPDDLGQANVSQHVSIIRPAIDGLNQFLHCVILAPYFQAFIFDEQTGAGRGGLPKRKMDQIPIALPPIAEQKRIVTRVNELMVLCDRLESGLAVARTARSHLLESLLHEALGLTESGVKGAAASPQ